MIVTYVPSDEEVRDELLPHLWIGTSVQVLDILQTLRHLGYEVTRQVEITGPMEQALLQIETLPDGSARRVGRPKRLE